jgi:glyoxylase-like metal-dependent hydrolase (beta-lactamase superfamily II)
MLLPRRVALRPVLVVGVPALAFGTNCFVVAPAAGEECLVVDPGIGVVEPLEQVLAQHRLKPAAVLLTHGHLDHVFSVTPVCGARGIAAVIHPDDEYRLVDPVATLDPALVAMFSAQFGAAARWQQPDDVVTVRHGEVLTLAGLVLTVDHAPGHTEGSIMFRFDAPQLTGTDGGQALLSGDVLFAGSIGRTDLPGGDPDAMWDSLVRRVLPLRDDTLVLPGHGPQTTIGTERRTNPFLREAVMRTRRV